MNSTNKHSSVAIWLMMGFIAFLLFSFGSKVPYLKSSEIIIPNYDFEIRDSTNELYPANWEISGLENDFDVALDRTVFYTGKTSLHIHRVTEDRAIKDAYVKQNYPIKVDQLTKVTLSGLVKTENVELGWAGFYVSVKDNQGQTIYYNDSQSQSSRGSHDWREHELEVILDERASILRIGIALEGNVEGDAWFDHVQIDSVMSTKEQGGPLAVDSYISAFIDTVRSNSINQDSINWQDYEKTLYDLAKEASTIKDTYPIIRYGLGLLKDGHSFFKTPQARENWKGDTDSEAIVLPEVGVKYLGDSIGYINVPAFGSGSEEASRVYADTLHKKFSVLHKKYGAKKWVIDLRENSGGNMWPMLAGLGPLYGESKLGSFQGGSKNEVWYYRSGSSFIGDKPITTVSHPLLVPNFEDAPVSVLIGPMTGSSGEAVAISFIGRSNTKLFGLPTAGYSTANDDFELADGATVFLTVSAMSDREGTVYGGKIGPDVIINTTTDDNETDSTCKAATKWLRER